MSSFYDSVKYPVESTRPSIVVEWFRFKHTLEISVEISTSGKYRFSIWGPIPKQPEDIEGGFRGWQPIKTQYGFDSRIEAYEQAFSYCLTHLV